LIFRGFAAGDPVKARLCHAEHPTVAQNAGPISGLVKPFPGGIPSRERRPVFRLPPELATSLADFATRKRVPQALV
jgi:hypothetical protein